MVLVLLATWDAFFGDLGIGGEVASGSDFLGDRIGRSVGGWGAFGTLLGHPVCDFVPQNERMPGDPVKGHGCDCSQASKSGEERIYEPAAGLRFPFPFSQVDSTNALLPKDNTADCIN